MDYLNFIHLTDLHFQGDDEEPIFGFNTVERARMALDKIESLNLKPRFFVITGDLANNGTVAAYRKVQIFQEEITRRFESPVFHVLGNHDKVEGYEKAFGKPAKCINSAEIDDIALVLLSSKNGKEIFGGFNEEQMAQLENLLKEKQDKRILIFFHHPLAPTPHRLVDGYEFVPKWSDRFLSIISGRKNILGVFSGHTHYDFFSNYNGIPSFVCGGTAFGIDPFPASVMRFIDAGSFLVGTIRGTKVLASPVRLPHSGREFFVFDPSKHDVSIFGLD